MWVGRAGHSHAADRAPASALPATCARRSASVAHASRRRPQPLVSPLPSRGPASLSLQTHPFPRGRSVGRSVGRDRSVSRSRGAPLARDERTHLKPSITSWCARAMRSRPFTCKNSFETYKIERTNECRRPPENTMPKRPTSRAPPEEEETARARPTDRRAARAERARADGFKPAARERGQER